MAPRQESQKTHTDGEIQSAGRLLHSRERAVLVEIAKLEMPHSQRASVLLALDSGASQTMAGERVGMSPRQARYWRDRFIQRRLDIFPQDLVARVQLESLPEMQALVPEQEDMTVETEQEELEKMTDELQVDENEPEDLQLEAVHVEEQNQAGEAKKDKKNKVKKKKKDKKDTKAKKGKKKKSAKKLRGKRKSKKAKKKRAKK